MNTLETLTLKSILVFSVMVILSDMSLVVSANAYLPKLNSSNIQDILSTLSISPTSMESKGLPSLTAEFGEAGMPIPGEYIVTLENTLQPIVETPSTSMLNTNETSDMSTAITASISYLEDQGIDVTSVYDDGFKVTIPSTLSKPSPSGVGVESVPVTLNDIKKIFAPNASSTDVSGLIESDLTLDEANVLSLATGSDQICNIISTNDNIDLCEQNVIGSTTSQSVPLGIQRIGGPINNISEDNKNVTIAVMDSGVSPHPDINLIGSVTFIGDNKDNINHGTHVAGIIAAKGNNGIGVVGVDPGAKIFSVKVLDNKAPNSPGSLDTFKKGLEFIRDHAESIDVVNLSITLGKKSEILNKLIEEIVAKGIIVVGAAGNSQEDASLKWPGSDPNIVVVGAISDNDGKCGGLGGSIKIIVNDAFIPRFDIDDNFANSYSNFGSVVDIVAPGTNILSTSNSGSYMTTTGTSMASPHVTGAAALYIESHPSATPNEVIQHLKDSAISQTQICHSMNNGGYIKGPNGPAVELVNIAQTDQDSSLNFVINKNSRLSEVNLLQRMLTILGYSPGIIDGKFGPKTESAVKQFQQDDGLTVDGEVKLDTWTEISSLIKEKLNILNSGKSGMDVNLLQRMLTILGYSPGIIDGKFGPKTESAVKQFQQDDGLTVDGIVRTEVWSAMFSKIPYKLTDATGPTMTGLDSNVEGINEMHLSILSAVENLNSSINNLTKTIELHFK